MHLLFVDESGTPDKSFGVGGIAVRAADWPILREAWTAALARHEWPHDREIKWHAMTTGLVPPALAEDVVATLASAPITCLCIYIKIGAKQRRPDLFADPNDAYSEALMWLAERYQKLLEHEDSHGVVVLDQRDPESDGRIRRHFERLSREGTPYLELSRIIDAPLLAPSHYSIGLQAADVVVGTAVAAQKHLGDGSRFHKQLLPRFNRHPATGELDGVGMVVYPKRESGEEALPTKLFGGERGA